MRIFLILVIFAIGFSGYSNASHAMNREACASLMQSETVKNNQIPDCGHHGSVKKDASKKAGKSACLDCVHCCTSHVTGLPDLSVSVKALPAEAALVSSRLPLLKSERLFSLLRPPRNLV